MQISQFLTGIGNRKTIWQTKKWNNVKKRSAEKKIQRESNKSGEHGFHCIARKIYVQQI